MINYNVDSDGIATITWDMPGRSMNVLNEASMTAYAGAIEEAIKDDKVKGIILTSAKADFIAGADLEMLLSTDTSDAAKLMDQFSQLQKMFRRQETGGKPIVAAINGTALGGGFEICLACHYRIAVASAKVGLPDFYWTHMLTAAAKGQLAHPDAGAAVARIFAVKPNFSARVELRKWNAAPADLAHILEGLVKAGLHE